MRFLKLFRDYQTAAAIIIAILSVGVTFLIFFIPAQAKAENVQVIGNITDHYKIVIDRNPYNIEICQKGNKSGLVDKDQIIDTKPNEEKSLKKKLADLKELFDQNLINEEEYNNLKGKLLDL